MPCVNTCSFSSNHIHTLYHSLPERAKLESSSSPTLTSLTGKTETGQPGQHICEGLLIVFVQLPHTSDSDFSTAPERGMKVSFLFRIFNTDDPGVDFFKILQASQKSLGHLKRNSL
jgi:hypothetical protein